jgi:50S ribosomal subunit-associated GTPase HflX
MAPADYFLLKKAKMGAGMPEPGPGQHQELLGESRPTSDRRRLRRHLQKLGGALQKARSPRWQVRRKILRNKHPPSSHRCHFIYTFAFVCIHTSKI